MRDEGNHNKSSKTPRKATPRQRQVLELASIGLSDREIATRMRVSTRAIRFEFEKVFGAFGVRNRADAVAAWLHAKDHTLRPPDECPYPKPFPDRFTECPGYVARQTAALDERARPTNSMWTCRHLEARLVPGTENRWYGACILGSAIDRERWAEEAGPHRVRMLNLLLHDLAPLTRRFAQQLWTLKADEVRAVTQKQDVRAPRQSMEAAIDRFMDDLETFLDRHRWFLEESQLAIDGCLNLARQLVDRVLAQRSPDWDDTFDRLVRFPEDLWSVAPAALPERPAQVRR